MYLPLQSTLELRNMLTVWLTSRESDPTVGGNRGHDFNITPLELKGSVLKFILRRLGLRARNPYLLKRQ